MYLVNSRILVTVGLVAFGCTSGIDAGDEESAGRADSDSLNHCGADSWLQEIWEENTLPPEQEPQNNNLPEQTDEIVVLDSVGDEDAPRFGEAEYAAGFGGSTDVDWHVVEIRDESGSVTPRAFVELSPEATAQGGRFRLCGFYYNVVEEQWGNPNCADVGAVGDHEKVTETHPISGSVMKGCCTTSASAQRPAAPWDLRRYRVIEKAEVWLVDVAGAGFGDDTGYFWMRVESLDGPDEACSQYVLGYSG